MKKLFYFFGLLALVSSCTVEDGSCGNGVLDDWEECDGSKKKDDVEICGVGYEIKEFMCSYNCKISRKDCELKEGYERIASGIAECKSNINYNTENETIEGVIEINKSKLADDLPFEACMECISTVDTSNIANINNFALGSSYGCGGLILTTDDDGKLTITQGRKRFTKPGEYHCFIYARGKEETIKTYDKDDDEDYIKKVHNVYYCSEKMAAPKKVTDALLEFILKGDSKGLFQYEFSVE